MELYHGFRCETFEFEEHEAVVVFPNEAEQRRRLMIKTEYMDAFPDAIELPLLREGFHLCHIRNDNRWATEEDLSRKSRFISHVQEKYHLDSRCIPIGMSCGGLYALKMAVRFPKQISCLYLDAPLVDILTCACPYGRNGFMTKEELSALGSRSIGALPEEIKKRIPGLLLEITRALNLDSIAALERYRDMPVNELDRLAECRIPAVLVIGDDDRTVPVEKNALLLKKTYEDHRIPLAMYVKRGGDHHPHGVADPSGIAAFIRHFS